MTFLEVVFIIVALVTLAAAVMTVSTRRMMHAALWLVLTLFGVAVLFATLESSFFTVVQVVVYIGAIAILIIFAVMLTQREIQESGPSVNRLAWLAGVAALAIFGALSAVLSLWPGFSTQRPAFAGEDIVALGKAFVSPDAYVIPFEIASVLLIGALIGAIYVAGEPRK
jgi:NADH-quinone oxidoreductase subunit J